MKKLLCLLLTLGVVRGSRIRIESDGGYAGIVVKISDDVPEDNCPEIIANVKVRNPTLVPSNACSDREYLIHGM